MDDRRPTTDDRDTSPSAGPRPLAVGRPSLIIFQAGVLPAASPIEALVAQAWFAATLDLLTNTSISDAFDQVILVTEDSVLRDAALALSDTWPNKVPLHVETRPSDGFHFGENLRAVCKSYNLQRVVYVGGGSMPLGTPQDLHDLAIAVSGEGECVVSNNLYSADQIAFYPASALDRIALPTADNDLAWLLHYRAGLPFAPTPRTLAFNFDLDTPTDLATLWWSTQSPPLNRLLDPHLATIISRVPEATLTLASTIERAYKVMSTRRAELLVAGRLSSWVWRRLETNLPCQTRILSEERGMRASGREAQGEVRSLLGLYTDLAGIPGLISALEQTSNAAFLDTRVLFAHRRLDVSPHDRFASDALQPDQISDPWVRELTEASVSSSIPIVLGGHSLVAGGLWAFSERVRGSASAAS